MTKPSAKIIDRAHSICLSDRTTPDGTSYRPSNGTEGSIFEGHWCHQCKHDTWGWGGEKSCDILMSAHVGEQPPEWMYWNGAPLCTKFRHFQEQRQPRATRPRSVSREQFTLFAMENPSND